MQIQLRWVDPTHGQEKTPQLETPVLFGSSMAAMPSTLDGQPASRMVLNHEQVEPFHAVIEVVAGQLYLSDRNSRSGTKVNRVARSSHPLKGGDRIQIGPFEILVSLPNRTAGASAPLPDPGAITPPPLPNTAVSSASANSQPSEAQALPKQPSSGIGGFVAPIASGVGGSDSFAMDDDSASGMGADGMGADGTCNNKVGFLIKRRCGRTTTAGCKFCRNGQVDPNHDLYTEDYSLYPDYGYYGRSAWGSSYYYNRDRYYYDSSNRRVDFTEADGASFENESDQDYEMDLDAS